MGKVRMSPLFREILADGKARQQLSAAMQDPDGWDPPVEITMTDGRKIQVRFGDYQGPSEESIVAFDLPGTAKERIALMARLARGETVRVQYPDGKWHTIGPAERPFRYPDRKESASGKL